MSSKTLYWTQADFEIRCEWGMQGVATLAPISDVMVIVDVLSFSTTVDVAVSRSATIYPYRGPGDEAADYAKARDALLAVKGRVATDGYSLAPTSMLNIPAGTRLVLPSPNGSTLSLGTGTVPTFAGCLRNAKAVAKAAGHMGRHISVIAAGERWPDGSLRPSLEDQLGAGAIIHYLRGIRSPEADAAEKLFLGFQDNLETVLMECGSGKELIDKGFADDVRLAADLNSSNSAPLLMEGAYRQSINTQHD